MHFCMSDDDPSDNQTSHRGWEKKTVKKDKHKVIYDQQFCYAEIR